MSTETKEIQFTLANTPKTLKGTKPERVVIGDKTEGVISWKAVYTTILKDCYDKFPEKLMNLRGDLLGKKKAIIAETKEGMNNGVELATGLFAETCFSADGAVANLKLILEKLEFDLDTVTIVTTLK
jgi:hypothetical protein